MNGPEAELIRQRIERWAEQIKPIVKDAWPTMPKGIEDLNADVWEALLAVADAAGGDWPERARATAVTVVTDSMAGEPSLGVQLLTDLRTIFGKGPYENLETTTVVKKLNELEDAPWGDLHGRELNARSLSQRLRGYDVRPKPLRIDGKVVKGYAAADLHDSWSRYLPPLEPSDPEAPVGDPDYGSVTSVTTVATPNAESGPAALLCSCGNIAEPDSPQCWQCGG